MFFMDRNKLLSNHLKKIQWVFVGLTHPGNLGAILRALKNTGCSPPILIDPGADVMINCPQVRSRAAHAKDYVNDIEFRNLETALGESRMVIGFTARDRDIQVPKKPFEEILETVSENLLRWDDFKVSFVFGSEKCGLSNKELSRCTLVCTLDVDESYPSLNISHATLLVAYSIRNTIKRIFFMKKDPATEIRDKNNLSRLMKKPARQKTLYSLERSMIFLAERVNFFNRGKRENSEMKMRRWIVNNNIEEEDARLMISFFSEIGKKFNCTEDQ